LHIVLSRNTVSYRRFNSARWSATIDITMPGDGGTVAHWLQLPFECGKVTGWHSMAARLLFATVSDRESRGSFREMRQLLFLKATRIGDKDRSKRLRATVPLEESIRFVIHFLRFFS
jgi:hypothetical protein